MRNNDLWGTKVTKTFAYTLLYMYNFVFFKILPRCVVGALITIHIPVAQKNVRLHKP